MSLPFDEWLVAQRWYAGRNRELSSVKPAVTVSLRDDLDLVLLDASYTDGPPDRYQVIVRWDTGPIEEYADIATIGVDGDRTAYDALYNPADAKYLLSLFDSSATVGDVRFGDEPERRAADRRRARGFRAPNRATPASSSRNRPSSRCSAGSRRASTPTSS